MKGCTSGVLKLIDTTCDVLRVSYYVCRSKCITCCFSCQQWF